ncbi:SUMF1/EgtB/PvdO family nonheme iron enzyme [Rhodomicrobium sp. Az07]|uniref:SUMF1/EgtB/PvdO family nonheme iron enzyme n=1 Tax=Rhodomicrobium sp. Az07 TaxID=2839034 RepID=UPI001BEBF293|nr:SUMF1/EgtB/PvdO family nonheme iron enzyme [Rhodomicrobium sp. Az07]MBT3071474.1 SUMF1/EgtB/PvdO family nonheme iron enzyme [Rhodomicrobium sp. Az07]
MADIFISYSKANRSLAEALANDLLGAGYSVWWDTELVGGEEFKNVILKELDAAQAVIVIWTPASVTSNWVYSEASRAQAQKKLITVKSADLDMRLIPPPFDTLHVDPLDQRARLFVALGKLGVEAGRNGGAPRNEADEALWEEVLSLRDPQLYIHYLKTFPFGTHAHEADEIIWRDVRIQDSASGYLWYLREFPAGNFSTEAEDAYWRIQRAVDTFEAFADYLKNRPQGRHRRDADLLLWKRTESQNTVAAYEAYIAASPSGIKIEVAKLRPQRLRSEQERQREIKLIESGGSFRDFPNAPEMVVIPAGAFWMGSKDDEGDDSERPRHRVTIPQAFALGKYPVTFEEWDAYVADGGGGFLGFGTRYKPDDNGWGRGRRPVIDVSWDNAQAYVKWLSEKTGKLYRLPSEAEWEYACRAGTETAWFFGSSESDLDRYGWYKDNSGRKTHPVGEKLPNAFGLHDLHGNVWEWCEDCWNDSYAAKPEALKQSGGAWTAGDCFLRVLRGGSWGDGPQSLRSADRFWSSSDFRLNFVGFRAARTLNP